MKGPALRLYEVKAASNDSGPPPRAVGDQDTRTACAHLHQALVEGRAADAEALGRVWVVPEPALGAAGNLKQANLAGAAPPRPDRISHELTAGPAPLIGSVSVGACRRYSSRLPLPHFPLVEGPGTLIRQEESLPQTVDAKRQRS